MMIIGCDLHTRYQQRAMVDTDSGELVERRLEHESGEARAFYAGLKGAVRVGIEATGHTAWFEALLAELGYELWMGDAGGWPTSDVCFLNVDHYELGVPHFSRFSRSGLSRLRHWGARFVHRLRCLPSVTASISFCRYSLPRLFPEQGDTRLRAGT